MARMARYDWPGNIRELENVLISSAVSSDDDVIRQVLLDELPMRQPDLAGHSGALIPMPVEADQVVALAEYEMLVIEAALQACEGNLSECARRLGIGRATLRRKLARGIQR
jgi:DNA-binding NtrC family response regulator